MFSVMSLFTLYVRVLDITSKFRTMLLGLVTYISVQLMLSPAVGLCSVLNCDTRWLSVFSRLVIFLPCDILTLCLSRVTKMALRFSDFTSSFAFCNSARSEVLTAVLLKIKVFWDSFIFTSTCTTIMSYFLHPYICFDYLLVIIRGIKVYTQAIHPL